MALQQRHGQLAGSLLNVLRMAEQVTMRAQPIPDSRFERHDYHLCGKRDTRPDGRMREQSVFAIQDILKP